MEVYLQAYLTSALDGGNWSVSWPGPLTSAERAPSAHWIGGSVGPSQCGDRGENKNLLHPPGTELGCFSRPAFSRVAMSTELSRFDFNSVQIQNYFSEGNEAG
jgi:hypothetical protein